jgi:inner membrane protein
MPEPDPPRLPRWAAPVAAASVLAGDAYLRPRRPRWVLGVVDECAHLATGTVLVAALGGRLSRRAGLALIACSVVLDADHVPEVLGRYWLTAGSSRPYPHSFGTLLAAGALWARGRRRTWGDLATGALIGLAGHFARDFATGPGVAILWPLSSARVRVPYAVYALALVATAGTASGAARPRRRRS